MVAVARVRAQGAEQAEPVEARHHHVAQHEVGRARARMLEQRPAPSATASTVQCGAQQAGHVLAHVGVVVGEQDAAAVAPARRRARPARPVRDRAASAAPPRRTAAASDRRRRRRPRGADPVRRQVGAPARDGDGEGGAPAQLALDLDGAAVQPARARAPGRGRCPSPRGCASARPRTRWKRSKTCGSSSAAIPMPVSRDLEHRPARPPRAARTVISPSKVNLKALERRLRTIFSHISRSTHSGSASGGQSTRSAKPRALDGRRGRCWQARP